MAIKTESAIERDFLQLLKDSSLASELRGRIYRDEMRPADAKTEDVVFKFMDRQPMLEGLISFAKRKDITPNGNELAESREVLTRSIYSNIIYHMLGMMEHIKFVNLKDSTVLKAVEILESGKAFPEIEG